MSISDSVKKAVIVSSLRSEEPSMRILTLGTMFIGVGLAHIMDCASCLRHVHKEDWTALSKNPCFAGSLAAFSRTLVGRVGVTVIGDIEKSV